MLQPRSLCIASRQQLHQVSCWVALDLYLCGLQQIHGEEAKVYHVLMKAVRGFVRQERRVSSEFDTCT